MRRTVAIMVGAGILIMGCESPNARLNAPPHGGAYDVSELQGTLVYMSDNAILSDMTVSDMHFLPHRAQLNGLGEQRVMRLANLLNAYGGTVRLSTNLTDDALIHQRSEIVVAALAEHGVDTTADLVRVDLPGGFGMDAAQAILIKKHEGTYKERKQGSSAPTIFIGGGGGG